MLRKLVLGTVGVATLMPVVGAATPLKEETRHPNKPPPMRPSELPIYEAPHADYAEYVQKKKNEKENSYIKKVLITPVRAIREQVQVLVDHTDHVTHSIQDQYHDLQDKSESDKCLRQKDKPKQNAIWIFKYLREEENKEVRYGAVAMGGVTGFIFGLRGGIIRRVLYAGAGTTAMGFVCFPEETRDLLKDNSTLAKQYINIAYNFLYGVKPGDPQLEVKFPELSFPKDFSGLMEMTVNLASSVKQAIMPPPTKEEIKSAEHKE